MQRVVVATDRSKTAERAVAWAAELAARYAAELVIVQVIPAANGEVDIAAVEESLQELAREIAGERGQARVRVHPDPPQAIVDAAADEGADVLVVGNAGMSGRKEFLLGNVPNRISHNARCTVVIVNTTDGMPTIVTPAPVKEEDEGQDLLARAAKIGKIVGKYGLAERAEGHTLSTAERAKRLREALEQLGPTFSKLGQILSTRPDLLPQEFVEELAHLQDNVPPLTEAEVVAVMEQELRVPWEDVFASIEPEPLAAGTIAQVHRARSRTASAWWSRCSGRPPRGRSCATSACSSCFAEKAADRPALRRADRHPRVVEPRRLAPARARLPQEAANIERMREVLEPFDRLDVPRVYSELTTRRLLVMEEIQGGPIRDAPEGQERTEAARQLLEAYYRQVLPSGFFHADPHPGTCCGGTGRSTSSTWAWSASSTPRRASSALAVARFPARGRRVPGRGDADARRESRRPTSTWRRSRRSSPSSSPASAARAARQIDSARCFRT